jgi:hypothetical protein
MSRHARRFPNGQFAPKAWKPIESSNLAYGAATDDGTLYMEFRNGTIYRYHGVPPGTLDVIVGAGADTEASAGHEFYELVKQPGYQYEQVM